MKAGDRVATGWISINDRPITDEPGKTLVWHVYCGAMVMDYAQARKNRYVTHWQEIDPAAWIRADARRPRQEDADIYNCVISLDAWGGISLAGWHRFANEKQLTGWQRVPEPPGNAGELRKNAP